MDTQRVPGHMMPGIVTGVPKRSTRPIVDGIVTGCPRKPKPALATPTQKPDYLSATKVPHAAFGSGMFGEGAGAARAEPARGRGRAKKEAGRERSSSGTPLHGTTKGEMRKTARRAYEK